MTDDNQITNESTPNPDRRIEMIDGQQRVGLVKRLMAEGHRPSTEPVPATEAPPDHSLPSARPKRARNVASPLPETVNPLKFRETLGELRGLVANLGPLPGAGEGHRNRLVFVLGEILEGE